MPPAAPERPRPPPARAGRLARCARLPAERCSVSPNREIAGRIEMFCSLVQIGQFWSRRLWRQNDGIRTASTI